MIFFCVKKMKFLTQIGYGMILISLKMKHLFLFICIDF